MSLELVTFLPKGIDKSPWGAVRANEICKEFISTRLLCFGRKMAHGGTPLYLHGYWCAFRKGLDHGLWTYPASFVGGVTCSAIGYKRIRTSSYLVSTCNLSDFTSRSKAEETQRLSKMLRLSIAMLLLLAAIATALPGPNVHGKYLFLYTSRNRYHASLVWNVNIGLRNSCIDLYY